MHQRLRIVSPKLYQRVVGPLHVRIRDKQFQCYCNNPKSLNAISKDILAGEVPPHALPCDACWQEDLATTWGYFGWAIKVIPKQDCDLLCDRRAHMKFVD